jgi:hypothetical protein
VLGTIALAECIGAVLLAQHLRDIRGNDINDCFQTGFMESMLVCPGCHGVRVDQAIMPTSAW